GKYNNLNCPAWTIPLRAGSSRRRSSADRQSASALRPRPTASSTPQRHYSLHGLVERRSTSPDVDLFLLSLFEVSISLSGNASPSDFTQASYIIEEFQKCHLDHPVKKFFGECTDLKIKLDRCFRQEKALKRKANFEESKKFKEQLQAYKREIAEENKE
ncbi:hypothetical protein U9M48_023102, partial [Paspalum notatum var. saurae]